MIQLLHYRYLHNQTWCAAATFWRYGTSAIGPTGNRLCTRPSCTNMYAIPNIVIPKPCKNDQFLLQSHNLINKWMHNKRGTPIMGDTFRVKVLLLQSRGQVQSPCWKIQMPGALWLGRHWWLQRRHLARTDLLLVYDVTVKVYTLSKIRTAIPNYVDQSKRK